MPLFGSTGIDINASTMRFVMAGSTRLEVRATVQPGKSDVERRQARVFSCAGATGRSRPSSSGHFSRSASYSQMRKAETSASPFKSFSTVS